MKSFDSLVPAKQLKTVRENARLKHLISQTMPAALTTHLLFCRLEGGRLRLTVDSAAWIPRLRFSERQILGKLKNEGFNANTVSYHVAASQVQIASAGRKSSRQPLTGSDRSSRAIEAAAAMVLTDRSSKNAETEIEPGDQRLHEALQTLARHLKSRD